MKKKFKPATGNKLRKFAITIIGLLTVVITLSLPLSVGYLIDQLIEQQSFHRLLVIGIMICSLVLIRTILIYCARQSITKLQNKIKLKQKSQLVTSAIEAGGYEYQKIELMFAQIDRIANLVAVQYFRLLSALLIALVALGYLYLVDLRLLLVIIFLLLIYLLFSYIAQARRITYDQLIDDEYKATNEQFSDLIRNIDLYKMNLLSDYKLKQFLSNLTTDNNQLYKASRLTNITEVLANNLYLIITVFVLVGYSLGMVNESLTLGEYATAVMYTGLVFAPVRLLIDYRLNRATITADYHQISQYITEHQPAELPIQIGYDKITDIELVNPKYQNKVKVNVRQKLEPGQVFVMQAPSQSGKTLVGQMILRLQPLDRGTIKINGVNISQANQKFIWERSFYASQVTNTFVGTFLDNILIGSKGTNNDLRQLIEHYQMQELTADIDWKQKISNPNQLTPAKQKQLQVFRLLLAEKDLYVLDQIEDDLDEQWKHKLNQIISDKAKSAIVIKIVTR